MKANELERAVIGWMLADSELNPARSAVNFDAVTVTDREFTGVGFFADFEHSEELKLFDDEVSLRWGKVGARLNASKLETGYVVFVDDGYVTCVEGYTYGDDDWPSRVEQIELYEAKLGMELPNATPWWKRSSIWFGIFEVGLGLSLGFFGFRAGAIDGSSLGEVMATMSLFIGLFALCIPGLLLVRQSRYRWHGQLVPVALIALYFLALLLE